MVQEWLDASLESEENPTLQLWGKAPTAFCDKIIISQKVAE